MAEKMRYGSNENESGNVDDEFNNANEELYPEDIYRVYMEEIAAIPPCSEEENEKLLGEIRSGNKAARERLIEGNLKNVDELTITPRYTGYPTEDDTHPQEDLDFAKFTAKLKI